jgi:hypothetical protein
MVDFDDYWGKWNYRAASVIKVAPSLVLTATCFLVDNEQGELL